MKHPYSDNKNKKITLL